MTVEFHDFTPTRDPIEDELMALREALPGGSGEEKK